MVNSTNQSSVFFSEKKCEAHWKLGLCDSQLKHPDPFASVGALFLFFFSGKKKLQKVNLKCFIVQGEILEV